MSTLSNFLIQVGMATATRQYWGPRLWRVFHLMANVSDRRDISALWRQFLGLSAAALPCAQCRGHFTNYLRNNVIIKQSNPLTITGPIFRDSLKTQLRIFHNTVNLRLGKPIVSADAYKLLYPNRPRQEVLFEVQTVINEIKAAWEPLLHSSIHPAVYSQWKGVYGSLFHMLASGPQ